MGVFSGTSAVDQHKTWGVFPNKPSTKIWAHFLIIRQQQLIDTKKNVHVSGTPTVDSTKKHGRWGVFSYFLIRPEAVDWSNTKHGGCFLKINKMQASLFIYPLRRQHRQQFQQQPARVLLPGVEQLVRRKRFAEAGILRQ